MNVPGFKAGLTRKLLDWRRSVEQSFIFNPATGVPAHEQHALDQKYRQKRDPLEKTLIAGPAQLQDIASRGNVEVQHLRGLINQKATALAQPHADLRVVPANL
jgi:DNA-binding helix-hairpin-helix protein with protein kinase domain